MSTTGYNRNPNLPKAGAEKQDEKRRFYGKKIPEHSKNVD